MGTNSPIVAVTVHCSASKPDVYVDAKVIDRWHRLRGFAQIGYHYVIKRDGTIELGRPHHVIGAHVEGHNKGNLGICLAGGVDENGRSVANYTPEQYKSLITLLNELLIKYPRAEIKGHRDWAGVRKDCPCFNVKQWWEKHSDDHLKGVAPV